MGRHSIKLAACALGVAYLTLIVSANAEEGVLVTCGSLVKLEHQGTGNLLHSHEVSYGVGRGSGQQSVTGYPDRDSSGSLWIVRGVEVKKPL
jgi:dolichyl-phosphate-mannose--protein O-mannosyl transferase